MSYQWIHQTQIYRRLFNILIVIYSIHEEFIECSSASNPCKLSFDDNAIKTLSDVRQLVCPFVLQNGHKYWMRMRWWLQVTKDST